MALSDSILTLEKRLDERNQPKVGYVSPGKCGGEDESCSTNRNQLFLGYGSEVLSLELVTTRIRLGYEKT